jgi:hypothetical protein
VFLFANLSSRLQSVWQQYQSKDSVSIFGTLAVFGTRKVIILL